MRIFYHRKSHIDSNDMYWTTWVLSAGINQFDPMFSHTFVYSVADERDQVADALREFKVEFLETMNDYYRTITWH